MSNVDKRDGGARKAAKEAGLVRYFTGKPCKNGHIAERQVSNGVCVECSALIQSKYRSVHYDKVLERNRKYRANNPEWTKEQNQKFYAAHKEQHSEQAKIWRSKNIEKLKADKVRWREENREAHRAQRRNRKARKRQNGGTHTAADILDILRMQKFTCAACPTSLKKNPYHVDHIIPLSKGGGNGRRNLQILCVECNLEKSALDPHVFMRRKGKLL
jgi:5-methylcytosine-specific restriction endonuclease McrA